MKVIKNEFNLSCRRQNKKVLSGRKEMVKMKKFLKGIRSKQVLVGVLAVMVIAAGYYRVSENRENQPVTSETLPVDVQNETEKNEASEKKVSVEDESYFSRARYERDCMRSETVEVLAVSSVENEDGEKLKEKINEHEKNAENENAIESSVKAKGFEDCVAFVDEEGVKVVVKAKKLDAAAVREIKNIIVEKTGKSPTEIKISNKE